MANTPLHPSVLVVDDHLAIRTIVSDVLSDNGYRVKTAAHGGIALDLMRASPEPLVVTLDLNMPHVSGLAVLKAVAADPVRLQRHAIILVTAELLVALSAQVETLCNQLGIPLLVKPFTEEQLLDAVAEAEHRLKG
jgi:CheY-like chemotaxis protein